MGAAARTPGGITSGLFAALVGPLSLDGAGWVSLGVEETAPVVGAGTAGGESAVFFTAAGEDLETLGAAVADFPAHSCLDALARLLDFLLRWRHGDVAVLGEFGDGREEMW